MGITLYILSPKSSLAAFQSKKKLLLTLEGARRGKACILGKNSTVYIGGVDIPHYVTQQMEI